MVEQTRLRSLDRGLNVLQGVEQVRCLQAVRKTAVGSPAGGGSGGSGTTPWLAGRAAGELIASGSRCEPQGKPPAVQGAQGGRPGLRLLGCSARPQAGCCDQAVQRRRVREHAKRGTAGRLAWAPSSSANAWASLPQAPSSQ